MLRKILAAGAAASTAIVALAANAQGVNLTLPVRPGSWGYAVTPTGSEASFMDTSGRVQLIIRCTRADRTVAIAMRALLQPSMSVTTSSDSRALPAGFNPATGLLTAQLAASDRLLDSIAFSRGEVVVAVQGLSPLVVPAWAEPARAIEDCRI